jgi:hypothetical protein
LGIITENATTKARATLCSSLPLLPLSPVADVASAVENVSAAYSDTTAALHEYFDKTAMTAQEESHETKQGQDEDRHEPRLSVSPALKVKSLPAGRLLASHRSANRNMMRAFPSPCG